MTSTGASEPIVTAEMVRGAQDRHGYRPLLIVDIAVPRDVEAEAGQVENVFLYNIDDLDRIIRSNLDLRQSHRDRADSIISEHVDEFLNGLNVRNVAPTIEALYRTIRGIADAELAEAQNKLSGHDDAEEDMKILERALHRAVRRMLHPCAQRLRDSAGSDRTRVYVAALRELFDLDERDDSPGE